VSADPDARDRSGVATEVPLWPAEQQVPAEPAIVVDNLTKRYGTTEAVRGQIGLVF